MKNNNNKIYIISSVFILVSLFLVLFFIWPLFKEIEKNSYDLVLARNNIIALEAQNNETKNFKNNYSTYKPNLDRIDQLFVDPNNPVDFIEFLESTASSSQVTSQISLPPSSSGSKQFIVFQIISKGNFSNMMDFSKKIESGPYLIEIDNLTIQNSGEKSVSKDYSLRSVNATLMIKVFTKK